jgi:RHH-type transcriptional regulator, proline utilization regulon repressor / proline dehydrogenase / delta 1-pyrroline-5-carboxylate dehydrogenase
METAPEDLVADAERLAGTLWRDAARRRSRRERAQAARMARILSNPAARELILALTDEVLRVDDPARAGSLLGAFGGDGAALAAFGPLDQVALWGARALGSRLPEVVVPAARRRVKAEMDGVVLTGGRHRLERRIAERRGQGIRLNLNILGEAVLGEAEAERRLTQLVDVLDRPSVDYVSVKISSICSQLDVIAFDDEVARIAQRLRRLYTAAGNHRPPKFVNLDMEEYRDLQLTIAVFERVLDEPPFVSLPAGIVVQAYLPDSLAALEQLCDWARSRYRRTGGWIKVRIVKGANLSMERVEAEIRGWPAAPFELKSETDANYKRMLDVVLRPENNPAVKVGVASHNVFELAWAAVRAADSHALDRVEFEMLEGMSPALSEAVASRLGGLLLYEPVVDRHELDTAIAYLVRRLDENGAPDNFISRQFSLAVGSALWAEEAARFRRAVADADRPGPGPRRTQDRSVATSTIAARQPAFVNEPDTDFTVAANRAWMLRHMDEAVTAGLGDYRPTVNGRDLDGPIDQAGLDPGRPEAVAYGWLSAPAETIEEAIDGAKSAGADWASRTAGERAEVLMAVAEGLAAARGRLLAVMAVDTGKTVREGDPEVSEAIDFAHYYARHIPPSTEGFQPYGTVVVASPWNFPLSIPAGGVLGALAAGNAVILKPAPEAVAVAGELARVLWAAGVPRTALQFVPCVDGDASRLLIASPRVDAVVLTGSWETAQLFLKWRPELALHAETSGKNAIVVTATADHDEAIADLMHSAFGHAGQKCSAASLLILEASVYDGGSFLHRLADAVESLRPGPGWRPATTMGPLIRPPEGSLRQALTRLDTGERWLVEPRALDDHGFLWSPGVKTGVEPGSPFHLTECFGPVLGVMRAPDLDTGLAWQNQPAYGLTAGLQALDPAEIAWWRDRVEAGNLYVNRGITGAVVGRQPFGGWKRSVVGPGAKAGGPNYVASLGRWREGDGHPPENFGQACRTEWARMRCPCDATGLEAEGNAFRYLPLRRVTLLAGGDADPADIDRAQAAAAAVGVAVTVADTVRQGGEQVDKVRLIGRVRPEIRAAAIESGVWLDDLPVATDPGRELLRWVREQSVTESRHRHGDITRRRPGLV